MPIFGSTKQAVTRPKETKPSPSADQRSTIITSREEGRNFIAPRESEDTAEPKAGGMQRVRFADDRGEARCPMCAGTGRYHNNTPQPVAPFLVVVAPVPIPPQHPIPGYPPYNFVANTGILHGAAAAAPPVPIPPQHLIPGYPPYNYVANNTGVLHGAAAADPQTSIAPRPTANTPTTTAQKKKELYLSRSIPVHRPP